MNNNKLIAEFMGFTYDKNIGWHDNTMLMPQCVYDNQDGNCFDELLFNISWDWLMPVVEKCTQIGFRDTDNDDSPLYELWDRLFCDNMGQFVGNHIDELYNSVVEFIQESNNKKESENE